jgi:hypothetical protein
VSFIIVTRNPRSQAAFAVVKGPEQDLSEWPTKEEAEKVAAQMIWAGAWIWKVVEIDV